MNTEPFDANGKRTPFGYFMLGVFALVAGLVSWFLAPLGAVIGFILVASGILGFLNDYHSDTAGPCFAFGIPMLLLSYAHMGA